MVNIDELRNAAVAILALTAIDLTAIAIAVAYKEANLAATGNNSAQSLEFNNTADKFITGLTLFATFIGIIIIAIIGKIVISLFKSS